MYLLLPCFDPESWLYKLFFFFLKFFMSLYFINFLSCVILAEGLAVLVVMLLPSYSSYFQISYSSYFQINNDNYPFVTPRYSAFPFHLCTLHMCTVYYANAIATGIDILSMPFAMQWLLRKFAQSTLLDHTFTK